MPLPCDTRFEKGENKFGKRRVQTRADRVKKTTAHTLPSAPLELMNYNRFF